VRFAHGADRCASASSPPTLAVTGDPTARMAAIGVAVVLAGAALYVLRRRRIRLLRAPRD
jgi:LPXTG-motif cell wall-anchored protein